MKIDSIKDRYDVILTDNKKSHEWILNKHYAKRLPIINFAFCLVGFKHKPFGELITIDELYQVMLERLSSIEQRYIN